MPRAEIILDEGALGISRTRCCAVCYAGSPAIHLSPAGTTGIYVNPQTLQAGRKGLSSSGSKKLQAF